MILFDIPGRGRINVAHAVFDFNGTLAEDGHLAADTTTLLLALQKRLNVTVATADTFGTATQVLATVGIPVTIVKNGLEKERLVRSLVGDVAAVGNGANDALMFQAAALAIGVLGPEGAATKTLWQADVVVPSIAHALGLLLNPERVTATLRN